MPQQASHRPTPLLCVLRRRYNGTFNHPSRHQELPAVFLTRSLDTLVFYAGADPWTGGEMTRVQPGPGNKCESAGMFLVHGGPL